MKQIASRGICVVVLGIALFGQTEQHAPRSKEEPINGKSPTEVIDEMWRLATQGVLLTQDGWSKLDALFTKPIPFPADKKILVVSNDWGPAYDYKLGDPHADVAVGYVDMGKIDSGLRYIPPKKTEFVKTAFLYHLSAVTAYSTMYASDGKPEKTPVGSRAWKIEGSPDAPWTTVNTAVRYVLEMRMKTTDPTKKKNADETISKLLRLN
jgi:hypothetical protein